MQRFFLLNALASMVALAVAYPMSGEIMGPSVAKREDVAPEDEAAGVYFPISYDDDDKKRGKYY
ncbi:uncharacterized protein EDB93DRAFT_1254522 [Suillus bovinus]|uniref:uncharacterized protein n=1 Tax=Suillus bovinus TaxID=48563 RepID=UPI001B872C9D|nr:uncharacterized protein EDB93DRAFT_1254522 [Suillus bovinus]KAG2134402.1 hypothetical protein EDB93DRAFT_1254522 [Suillus bovinus]